MTGFDVAAKDFNKALPGQAPTDWMRVAELLVQGVNSALDKVERIRSQGQKTMQRIEHIQGKQAPQTSAPKVQERIVYKEPQFDEEKAKTLIPQLVTLVEKLPEEIKEKKIAEIPKLYEERKTILDALILGTIKEKHKVMFK